MHSIASHKIGNKPTALKCRNKLTSCTVLYNKLCIIINLVKRYYEDLPNLLLRGKTKENR